MPSNFDAEKKPFAAAGEELIAKTIVGGYESVCSGVGIVGLLVVILLPFAVLHVIGEAIGLPGVFLGLCFDCVITFYVCKDCLSKGYSIADTCDICWPVFFLILIAVGSIAG